MRSINSSVENKIDGIINNLKSNCDVLGLVMFGSRASNTHKKQSDVDLLVVLSKYDTSLMVLHPTIEDTGIRFDVWLTAIDELNKWHSLAPDTNCIHPIINNAILTGVILKDTDSLLEKTKEIIRSNNKHPLLNINFIRFKLTHGYESLEHQRNANPFLFNLMYYQEIAECVHMYGMINGLREKSTKDILRKIKSEDKKLYELLESSNHKEVKKDKLQNLWKVQSELLSKLGGHIHINEFIATGSPVVNPQKQLQAGKDLWDKLIVG